MLANIDRPLQAHKFKDRRPHGAGQLLLPLGDPLLSALSKRADPKPPKTSGNPNPSPGNDAISIIFPTANDDPYMQERLARRRERFLKDEERRKSLAQGKTTSAAHSRKRSYDETNANGENYIYPDAYIPRLRRYKVIPNTNDQQGHQRSPPRLRPHKTLR
jgi:hypothetical protein